MAGGERIKRSSDSARARSSRLRSKSGALIERSHNLIARSAFLAVFVDQKSRRFHAGEGDVAFHSADDDLNSSVRATGLGVADLWMRFAGLGGEATRFEIEAFLEGGLSLHRAQYDILILAVNERLDEVGLPGLKYRSSEAQR